MTSNGYYDYIKKLSGSELIKTARNATDWQVRRAAAELIDDGDILKDIVTSEINSSVAVTSLEKIEDSDFLCDVCLNHPDSYLRLAAVSRICDNRLMCESDISGILEEMLLNESDPYVLKSVCENPLLTGQDALTEALFKLDDENIKGILLSKITDEKILADFALESENIFLRRAAVRNVNLKDSEVISRIIVSDGDELNRMLAVMRIPDEKTFLEIIRRPEVNERLPEIARFTDFMDSEYFVNVFETSDDEYERRSAVSFIEDGDVLKNIILCEASSGIRRDAVRNINFNDRQMLNEMIKSEDDLNVLTEVISKIENQELLCDFVKNHLGEDIALKAIFELENKDFLKDLVTFPDREIRRSAVSRISELDAADKILRNIALSESDEEICLIALGAMTSRNDLIEVADRRSEKNIRLKALGNIRNRKLIYNYTGSVFTHSLSDIPFENALAQMAIFDDDSQIRRIATSKLNDKKALDKIASAGDVNSGEAQKRLDEFYEDIKSIENEDVLKRLIQNSDNNISSLAKAVLEDLDKWEERLSKIDEINDTDTLKDIALNDFNRFVRLEAEGKLEKILFRIRLDEINLPQNQEKLKSIVCDEGFTISIRRNALSKITDGDFKLEL